MTAHEHDQLDQAAAEGIWAVALPDIPGWPGCIRFVNVSGVNSKKCKRRHIARLLMHNAASTFVTKNN